MDRVWAEQEPRICIPVPAVPVQDIWQEKNQKICDSLNWFKGVTFTFWIKMHRKNIFPKINSKIYKFSGFFPAGYPVPALPEPEYKFLFPVLLTPYTQLYFGGKESSTFACKEEKSIFPKEQAGHNHNYRVFNNFRGDKIARQSLWPLLELLPG